MGQWTGDGTSGREGIRRVAPLLMLILVPLSILVPSFSPYPANPLNKYPQSYIICENTLETVYSITCWVDAGLRIWRRWSGPSQEKVGQCINGISDIYDATVVSVCRITARWRSVPEEQEPKRGNRIANIQPLIAIGIPANEFFTPALSAKN